jgi:hypothetical protein
MANEQLPLLFFKLLAGSDPLAVARSLLMASSTAIAEVMPLETEEILRGVRASRGFARLKVTPPDFSFDNPRLEAAFEGRAERTHVSIQFYGNFERVAKPLFGALRAMGLTCYSVWDKGILADWPEWEERAVDAGFAARMTRILERKTRELQETTPDVRVRKRMLDAFLKSAAFAAEMAAEARRESRGGGKKADGDLVNGYVRWRAGRPSAAELAGVRKLDPALAAKSVGDLRVTIGDSPRMLVRTAMTRRQEGELRRLAAELGLVVEFEEV